MSFLAEDAAGHLGVAGLIVCMLALLLYRDHVEFDLIRRTYRMARGFLPFARVYSGSMEQIRGIVVTREEYVDFYSDNPASIFVAEIRWKNRRLAWPLSRSSDPLSTDIEDIARRLGISVIDGGNAIPLSKGGVSLFRGSLPK